jgi:hypothetical protein
MIKGIGPVYAEKLAPYRTLLDAPLPEPTAEQTKDAATLPTHDCCPCCGGAMITLDTLPRPAPPRLTFSFWHDSS